MEVEHTASASTTISSPLGGKNNDRTYSGRQTTNLAATGDDNTVVVDQMAAVIGRSKCKVARKMEQGTAPARDTAARERGASAAPHPNY